MHKNHIAVAELLIDVETELRVLQLWDDEWPSREALASEQPFAIDTLTFPQWLQFIFLPRMYLLIDAQAPLPENSGIAPMAEQYFSVLDLHSAPLIGHLVRIDRLLSITDR